MQDTNFTFWNRLNFILQVSTINEPPISYYVTTLSGPLPTSSVISLFVLSGSVFRGHQPWKLCSRVQREDVWPDVHPEGAGACESSPWLVNKTCKWKLDMLLFVRLTLTLLSWLREIQRGPTWRSVTRWEGSPITLTSSTTWWELHCNTDEGTMRQIVFYIFFFFCRTIVQRKLVWLHFCHVIKSSLSKRSVQACDCITVAYVQGHIAVWNC